MRRYTSIALALSTLFAAPTLAAFSWDDHFTNGASSLWRNESGSWFSAGGHYDAASWNNFPNARSSVPFQLQDVDVSVDFLNLQDGGIWARSSEAATSVGRRGVLLVTGGNTLTGTTLYWHVVTDSYGASLAHSVPFINSGSTDATIRVTVTGNVYSAYINNSSTPATSITTHLFPSGEIALYDYSPNQSVDAVRIQSSSVIPGDANVDGHVNFDDLLALAQQYGKPSGATWLDGDFDGSGSVVFDDLLALAQHYGEPFAPASDLPLGVASDWSIARSLVPEPTSFLVVAGLLLPMRRR